MRRDKLRGNIDYLTTNVVAGWIESVGTSERHEIYCVDCDKPVHNFSPNLSRPDVAALDSKLMKSGFKITLSDRFAETHSGHRFKIRQQNHELAEDGFKFVENKNEQTTFVFVCELFDYLASQPNITGIQRYVLDILDEAFSSNHEHKFTFIAFSPLTNEFFSIDNLILEELLAEYAMGQSLKSSARKILESAEFNKVRFVKDDLFFCIGALWGVEYSYDAIRGLIKKGVKFIPFIYDLIPILESELHTSDEGMVVAFLRYMNFSIQNAPFICHLSKHTQKDFDAFTQKNFGTKMPGKVFGAIPKILGSSDNPSEKILELHNRNYILQVGTIEPRKCHTLTLKTFTSLVNTDPKFDLDLVFVGRKGWKMDSEWQVFEDSFQSGRVHHLTEISDDQLQTLYSEARFSVFPSRSEGWGLPISESLLFGTPCLVRNSGAMTEAGGEYATYFNDESEFERLFSLLCLDDNFLASETRKADKFTLSNQKSPLSHLLDIVKMPLGSSFSPRFLIEMGREYSFRNTSLSLNAARNQKLVTPFFSKTPTLKSFLESQTMLVNHLSDQFEACWMTKTSELSFAVPKDAKIFVMLSVFAESSGYLRISWMGDFCERYVEAGVNLVSFQISVGTSGLVTLKFLNRNLKTDSRNLEVAIDSMLVTKHDDYPTRELALHNWVNVGKEHAKTYRS